MSWNLCLLICFWALMTYESVKLNLNKILYLSNLQKKEITCLILYCSAILCVVHWPVKSVLNEYIINFKDYVSKLHKRADVYLIFDRYKPYSTKSVT